MTLTDAGPLVALLDNGDPSHARCVAAAQQLPVGPLITTWACFTEAMYLLGRNGGYTGQEALWRLRDVGKAVIHDTSRAEADRMRALMAQYRDTPMDLADASLVAAAETLNLRRVFTLDSHFRAYRMADKHAFDIVP